MTNYLIKNNIITKDNQEIYDYGIFVLLFNCGCLLSIILQGILLNNVIYSMYFLLFFVPIRVLLGGYHCKSPYSCFITFNLLFSINYKLAYSISQEILMLIGIILILISLILHHKENSHFKSLLYIIVLLFLIIDYFNILSPIYISSALILSSLLFLFNSVVMYFKNTFLTK